MVRHRSRHCFVGAIVGALAAIFVLGSISAAAAPTEPAPDPDQFRVAFIADTGYTVLAAQDLADLDAYRDQSLPLPARVLKLIHAEGADLVLHGGDIGYDEGGAAVPEKWDRMVTQILGVNFPLFASGGNHDQRHWSSAPAPGGFSGLGYRDVLRRRYQAVEDSRFGDDVSCSFPNGVNDIGQRASCVYKGTLTFITVGLGAGNGIAPTRFGQPDNAYESYLKSALQAAKTPWTVCNWHFNQTLFQTGYKTNEAGWKPYEYCRRNGALIATGHEHSYARTHLMSSFSARSTAADIVSRNSDLTIDEKRTIAWVSGLGGKGIRTVSDQASNPWWAAKVNLTNQPERDGGGVLFCDFSTSSNAHAECFYKTVNGVVHDRFRLVSNANGASGTFGGTVPEAFCMGRRATIVGTSGRDTLVGTDGDDVIVGRRGADTISGRGGNDTICAGAGNDVVHGGPGNDHVSGGRGDDTINGNGGRDRLGGGVGRDECNGGKGVDTAARCERVTSAR